MHKGRICEEIASGTEWNEMKIVIGRVFLLYILRLPLFLDFPPRHQPNQFCQKL